MIKDANLKIYKLKNNTLHSVIDKDSNKTITKKIRPKRPKLCWVRYG
jgi:hypothetical protein